MPFENHGSRSFTLISIEKNAPAASVVYGLADTRQWINIGETADIQAATGRIDSFSNWSQ